MLTPEAKLVISIVQVVVVLGICVKYWKSDSKMDKYGMAVVFAFCFAALLVDAIYFAR